MVRVRHLFAVLFALAVASALFVQPAFALVLHGEAVVDDDMTAQVSTEYVTRLAGNGALDTMNAIGSELGLDVRTMHEDIFNSMHRI